MTTSVVHKAQCMARCLWSIGLSLLGALFLPILVSAHQIIRHELHVVLQPDHHTLQVTDRITLPETLHPSDAELNYFALHAGLSPLPLTAGVQLVRRPTATLPVPGDSHANAGESRLPLERYAVMLPAGTRAFALQYQGAIRHASLQQSPQDAWSMPEIFGMLATEGIYLSGATYWYPRFDDELVTFTLDVQLPLTWEVVSQGERTRHERVNDTTYVRWESSAVQEDIYLIGGPLTEYRQSAGPVQAMVFLRTADAPLAQKYLDATAQYLGLYNSMLGPYPYPKFALVENNWESGYGMPSFTLLGSKVIRLPFIVSSSYPHEILHNWWGNGVFVDAQQGNWCEGLTAYLADHLLQEQRGSAVAYRRATLQRYTDYVAAHSDIPLTAFRARHSAATAAIGYGKALMFFHMLRQQIGDNAFISALQAFYRDNLFQRADFNALRRAFASVTGKDMSEVFQQWVTRPGAPELRISATTVQADGQDYRLSAVLDQVQPGPAYRLHVPLAVSLQGQEQAWQTNVLMAEKRLEFTLRLPAKPWRVDVDPEFDLFRRLHREEIPPALTQLFGADKVLLLLPAAAANEIKQGYRQLAQAWPQASSQALEIRWDQEVEALPTDRAVWLFGWENRFLPEVTTALTPYSVGLTQEGVQLEGTHLTRAQHAVVLTVRHPKNPQQTLAWVTAQNAAALPGLGRKLPHYSTYSFLGFAGDEPVNVVKGQWPVLASPMSVFLPPAAGSPPQAAATRLAPRRPLMSLP
jgi:Peptidase family M1 domain